MSDVKKKFSKSCLTRKLLLKNLSIKNYQKKSLLSDEQTMFCSKDCQEEGKENACNRKRQRRAIKAFRWRYISIGKFAEEMKMNVLKTRKWLKEHAIPQNNSFLDDDVKNA